MFSDIFGVQVNKIKKQLFKTKMLFEKLYIHHKKQLDFITIKDCWGSSKLSFITVTIKNLNKLHHSNPENNFSLNKKNCWEHIDIFLIIC